MNNVRRCLHLLTLVILVLYCHPAGAWSNGGCSDDPANPDYSTHDLIAQHALDMLPAHEKQYIKHNQLNEDETLRLGAFNIQVFGTTKASKPEVMDVLGKIIRTYDVVAIQEIRDVSQTALPALVDVVNSEKPLYEYVVGERLGRTTSKEQYAYIYNNQTVALIDTPHTYPEPADTDPFHREPYIASFKALGGNLDVTLIVIHVDPDEATEEIPALVDVIEYAQNTYPDEQDFIVMGDLNADCSYFDEDLSSAITTDYYWCINNSVDTTTKSTDCTYDRIIITNPALPDFAGDAGVFRFDIEYELTGDETTAVSDHYPVYAEFWCNRDTDSSSTPEVTDAVIALEIAVGSREYDPDMDVNDDGGVTSLDALMLLQAATATPTPEPTPEPTMYISDLNLQEEWVKITNSGASPITMTGWKITDEGEKHTYVFTVFILSSGATVTLHTGEGTDTDTELYWGSGGYIWNNDGDIATLYDASGNLIDTLEK